jgi:NAD(P)-dependent dehydrogenase (short-subunit alcohol dehydrogenase family)
MDSTRFSGRTALITGGTNGFGRATAELLVAGGARVLVTGRTATSLEETRATLGERAAVVRSDAASLSDTVALADRARAQLGALDLLFVNAGITRSASLAETDEAVYDEVFATNTKGAYFTVQALAPLIVDGGAVVMSTSVANVKGLPLTSVYAASKAALRSMVRTFARELLPRGIRVNAISPGPIDTGVLERSLPADVVERSRAQMVANNPMARFGRNEEVARAVAFLAFDATYTTGAELPVDGGVSQLL